MKRPEKLPKAEPWKPHDWDAATAYALRSLQTGTASPEQQMFALGWIIDACGTYDLEFRPDSERSSCFAAGKRWVGLQIIKLLNIPAAALHGNPHT